MSFSNAFINELKHESANTRKLLERVPDTQFGWKPHGKSMSLGRLATHVAELPGWITMIVDKDELDFATGSYKPHVVADNKELIALLDENVSKAITALESAGDEDMMKIWRLRNGEHIIMELPKAAVIRSAAINHMVHHRGQLTVFLRLNDVPLPGMYGPTADEN